ncbi:MAG: DUF1931 domain-containing protein [Pseudomonadales bacterium]|nr:DUF1931 domain-containing protein [Pseudomonadales bacterium]|tara:strand:- start:191 stop:364 length:174 start_codon:yes stop_codon:yes gene_type:complete
MLVKNQVKQYVKETMDGEVRVSGDFLDALKDAVQEKVRQACVRANANKRKTLQPHDL